MITGYLHLCWRQKYNHQSNTYSFNNAEQAYYYKNYIGKCISTGVNYVWKSDQHLLKMNHF